MKIIVDYAELEKLSFADLKEICDICDTDPSVEYFKLIKKLCVKTAEQKMRSLFVPVSKQWQYRPVKNPGDFWKNCSDEEYETMKHLARFEFQQIDI